MENRARLLQQRGAGRLYARGGRLTVASLIFPQMSEAATRATGDGFRILSTTKKDNYDHVFYHSC